MREQQPKLLLALVTATAIIFALYIGSRTQAALIAGLISATVDLVTLATIFLEGGDRKIEGWADDLAAQVELAWSHRRDILLGGTVGLTTRFERYLPLEMSPTGVTFERGDWSNVDEIFLNIPDRKMIILGEAGSGKTLITLRLVTSLLEHRKKHAGEEESGVRLLAKLIQAVNPRSEGSEQRGRGELSRIPVPISVIGWDGEKPLSDWLVSRLRAAYSVPRRRAVALVSGGYILPVLDGLDEAASARNNWRPTMRILYRLNTDYGARGEDGLRPLVLTCRTDEYQDLPNTEGDPLLSRRLVGAPVVVMLPLSETDIINYLGQQAEFSSRRIDRLASYLVENDNSVVVGAVSNPLVIALAVRAAESDRIDYFHLSQLGSKDAVRRYFIAAFVRSTTALYQKSFGRQVGISRRERSQDARQDSRQYYYETASVEEWLYYIAEYLKIMNDRSAGLRQPELIPQDLWKIADYHQRPVRRIHAIMAVIATLLTGSFGAEVAGGTAGALCWAVATALSGYYGFRVARVDTPKLSRVEFQRIWQGQDAMYLLPAVLAAGILAALLGYRVSGSVSVGVTEGIAAAALSSLLVGLSRGLARAVQPLDGLINDLRFGVLVGIVGAIAIGFPGGLTGGLWSHLHLNGILTRPGSQLLAFLLAIPCGIVLGSGGWLRLQIAAWLSRGKLLPSRITSFLRWAEAAGLLRAVGKNYQFRHEDLREWLLSNAMPMDHPIHKEKL